MGSGYGWAWWGEERRDLPYSLFYNAHQGGTEFLFDWTDVDREQNIRLYGTEIPEPATLTALGIVLAALSVGRARR